MTTQSVAKPSLSGKCVFCQAEVVKSKMTQHIKFCKQRQAYILEQEQDTQQPKTRLLHILAEGSYNPQYWMHFELSANASLWILDALIKEMWIEDLDHLSSFKINGTNYDNDEPDDFSFWGGFEEVEKKEEEEEEEEESEEEYLQRALTAIDELAATYTDALDLPLLEWLVEAKKAHSVDDLCDFLKEELVKMTKAKNTAWKESLSKTADPEDAKRSGENFRDFFQQEGLLKSIIVLVEDDSLDVLLKRVLKVGQKFSYIYDWGSSTYINLKVIAEREGIIANEEQSVTLLAQNTAPTFSCIKCGKPATQVQQGYYTNSIADGAFCTKCAKKQKYEEEFLPITNSPRVGVL
jgi:hypothetical protein